MTTRSQPAVSAVSAAPIQSTPDKRHEMIAELVILHLDTNDINAARKEMARLRKSRTIPPGVLAYLEGCIAAYEGDFSAAYQDLHRARRIFEKEQSDADALMARRLASVYEGLGRAYLQDCSFSNALIWFERSLLVRLAHNDKYGQARSYGFLRKLNEAAARYDRAIRYCQNQLVILRSVGDTFGECVACNSLVDLYLAVNEPQRAQNAQQKAAALVHGPHLAGSQPYVTLGQARLDLFHARAREAYARAAEAARSFRTTGDLERQGGAYLIMAEARAMEKSFGTASHLVKQAQTCFTRANLLRQRSLTALVECRIHTLRKDRPQAIASLCASLRLNFEYAGAGRGEEYFRDVIQTFLTYACTTSDAPWSAMFVKTAGFWKYYYQRRSMRRLMSGIILALADLHKSLSATPHQTILLSIERSDQHPWSGPTVVTPIENRGSAFGLLMLPASAHDAVNAAEMLSDAGFALGAIYEKKLSQRDGLTDLYNRRLFDMALEEECNRSRTLNRSLAVIMLDIDHFGNFNKKYGHDVGDAVLSQVAAVFRSELRDRKGHTSSPIAGNECPARYGGEEFVALLNGISADYALQVAEHIRSNIEALRINLARQQVQVTASIGVGYCQPQASFEDTLRCADEAMRFAKTSGRNCVAIQECGGAGPKLMADVAAPAAAAPLPEAIALPRTKAGRKG
jgi:diguanylate cyclase (GGDEF)-like protein